MTNHCKHCSLLVLLLTLHVTESYQSFWPCWQVPQDAEVVLYRMLYHVTSVICTLFVITRLVSNTIPGRLGPASHILTLAGQRSANMLFRAIIKDRYICVCLVDGIIVSHLSGGQIEVIIPGKAMLMASTWGRPQPSPLHHHSCLHGKSS